MRMVAHVGRKAPFKRVAPFGPTSCWTVGIGGGTLDSRRVGVER